MPNSKLQITNMEKIYFDNAATTPLDPRVLKAMMPYFKEKYGNASSLHSFGQEARKAIDGARAKVASFLGCKPKEVIFTSCASESNNLALKGVAEAVASNLQLPISNFHIIVSSIEHHCVLDSAKHLEKQGVEVTWLKVDKYGLVDPVEVEKQIKKNTILVSVMYVNNEVGTVEPIAEIGEVIKRINRLRATRHEPKVYFHTDAVQAIQYLNCNVNKLGVDFLSMSAHKFHGPKGVGALYIREKTPIIRQQDGGDQEYRLRAGTENVPYIVGLGEAIKLASSSLQTARSKVEKLRDRLIEGVLKIPGTILTGHPKRRAPHIASFIVKGVEGEAMLLLLDEKGIAVSTGSACTSGILEPSHVLLAMGFSPELAHGSLRISLSKNNTDEEISYFLSIFPKIVSHLRKMSPKKNVLR